MTAGYRKRDAETRAPVRPRGDVDPAVVCVDDLANDRQAEAGALWLGREERTEDLVDDVRRHAGAVVHHIDLHHWDGLHVAADGDFVFGGELYRRDLHGSLASHRFEGIGQEVGEQL